MQAITDEQMQHMLMQTKAYILVLLKTNPEYQKEGVEKILWEHGRKNFMLRAEGLMNIVAPVTAQHSIAGICIFDADEEKVKAVMNEDPAVKEGIFTYELLPIRSFPGDRLAG